MRGPNLRAAAVAALVTLSVGCPDSHRLASPEGREVLPPAETTTPDLEAEDLIPGGALASAEPAESDDPAVDRLATGGVLEPSGRLSVGLAGRFEVAGVPRARLSAADGQLAVEYLLAVGERARIGDAVFSLVANAEEATSLRWERAFPDPLHTPPVVREVGCELRDLGELCLEEMGLYRFSDGAVLAVGNVLADPEPAVTLCLYPPGYQEDPMQGYDRHFLARANAVLSGESATLRVQHLEPGDGGGWGTVRLEFE